MDGRKAEYDGLPLDYHQAALSGASTPSFGRTSEPNFQEIFSEFIGQSESLYRLLKLIHRASQTDSPVLICGESGTGKEMIASALHRLSSRAVSRWVPINCSAIPESLLESELFGHEKGAFTGASSRRIGYFERANGGTIFLDEIGEMPLRLQSKLLRVLQEKQFSPIGSTSLKPADVRIVAATNIKLADAVKRGEFRLDLFYRLNVLPLEVPSLRERGDDVKLLLHHFVQQMNLKYPHQTPCSFSPDAIQTLAQYQWPGNIRELQNLVERLTIMSTGGVITKQELPAEVFQPSLSEPPKSHVHLDAESLSKQLDVGPTSSSLLPDEGLNLTALVENLENNYILQALERTNNNNNKAAKLLGLNRTTLVERIKKRKLMALNAPSREL